MKTARIILTITAATVFLSPPGLGKSDWDESPAKETAGSLNTDSDGSSNTSSTGTPNNKPLQGVIEETSVMPTRATRNRALDKGPELIVPSVPGKPNYQSGQAEKDKEEPLTGKAIDDELRGMVRDGSLKPLSGLSDRNSPLKGQTSLNDKGLREMDPDADDQELMVEWDRWRNRFLRAVQLGVQEMVNNPDPDDYERPRVDPMTGRITSRYPLGTGCAFSCQITNDGQIKNLDILESSGFPKYDKAVWASIKQLEGTRILAFPKSSHRLSVTQAGRIKTATNSDFNYYHFGDVERVRSGQ